MAKKINYYTTERLGAKQSFTPEGFLLCEATPIARTGEQVYGPGEIWHHKDGQLVPMEVGSDGVLMVNRAPEEVFRPETVASFEGKPVVNGHPAEDVHPDNWRELAVGHMMNVRRGAGADDDLLLADLLITNRAEIDAVRAGLREVSCGYDADYEGTGAGRARQYNIYGNHLALVEAGRCGPRCAIGDSQFKELPMTLMERFRAAFKSKDEAAFEAVLKEVPAEGAATHVHVHTQDAHPADCDCEKCKMKTKDGVTKDAVVDAVFADKRFTDVADNVKKMADAFEKEEEDDEEEEKKKKAEDEANTKIEGSLEEEAPPGTGDAARKAKDSAYLADSWQDTISLGEIIAPGMQMTGTFDSKEKPIKTLDAICKFRRSVLDVALGQPDTRTFMDSAMGGRELKDMTCDGIRHLFRSVGAYKRRVNNDSRSADVALANHGGGTGPVGPKTPADLNKLYADFYKS